MDNSIEFLFQDNSPVWFVVINEEMKGPFQAKQIAHMLDTNEITFAHFTWKEGMEDWKMISDVEDFKILLPKKPEKKAMDDAVECTKSKIAPPPIPGAKKIYFLHIKEKQYGPYSKDDVEKFFSQKKIHAKTWIWKEGMESWASLGKFKDFEFLFGVEAELPEIELESDDSDKRQSPRKPLTAKILFHNEKEIVSGICEDISVGGMKVLTDKLSAKIQVGMKIKLNINPTGETSLKAFTAEGEIVRLLENMRGFSFKFLKLDDESRRSIDGYSK